MLVPSLFLVTALAAAAEPTADLPAAAAGPAHDDVIAGLGAALATLRAEVEGLAESVAAERRAAHDELAALERRRRDLEARLAQSTLTQTELQARADALATASAAQARVDDDARAPVRRALDALDAHIDRVPFRAHARHGQVERVRREVAAVPPAAAAALVWPLLVDEARLLTATGRARQAVVVAGASGDEPLVVEVAHVGAFVFWKARDGRAGLATLPPDGPARFVEVEDAEGRQRLALFFDALRREQKTGLFLLPNPLSASAVTAAGTPPSPRPASASTSTSPHGAAP